jgi:hypothetical protein
MSIEAVQRFREPSEFRTNVKEALTPLGKSKKREKTGLHTAFESQKD